MCSQTWISALQNLLFIWITLSFTLQILTPEFWEEAWESSSPKSYQVIWCCWFLNTLSSERRTHIWGAVEGRKYYGFISAGPQCGAPSGLKWTEPFSEAPDYWAPGKVKSSVRPQSSRRTMKIPKDMFHLSCPPSVALIPFLQFCLQLPMLFQAHELVYQLDDEYLEVTVISLFAKLELTGSCWERACVADRCFLREEEQRTNIDAAMWYDSDSVLRVPQKKKSALKHHGPGEWSWFLASVLLLATVWVTVTPFKCSTQKNLCLSYAFLLLFSLSQLSRLELHFLHRLCCPRLVCLRLCVVTQHTARQARVFRKQKLNEIKEHHHELPSKAWLSSREE